MKKKSEKKKNGRPREEVSERLARKKFSLSAVKKIAAHGLTDEELADILEVDTRTIARWKKDEKFLSCLKNGKLEADLNVEKALYHRAIGYSHKDLFITQYKGEIISEEIIKYYPPDTIACNSWLNNRRRHLWTYSPKPTSGLEESQTDQLRKLAEREMHESL